MGLDSTMGPNKGMEDCELVVGGSERFLHQAKTERASAVIRPFGLSENGCRA